MTSPCPVSITFTGEGKPILLHCGSWKCPICRRRLANEQARIAKFGVWKITQETGGECLFWTLTLGSAYLELEPAYRALPRLWNTLRMAIERDQKKFLYFACLEGQPQRDSMPHFHVLVFAHVPAVYNQRTDPHENIKDFAVACGFGHQADEKLVSSEKAAYYIGKYASKELLGAPKYTRRIRMSQKWPRPPKTVSLPFINRGKGEPVPEYLDRVATETARDLKEIVDSYWSAEDKFDAERLLTQ